MPDTDDGDEVWRYRDSEPVSFWVHIGIRLAAAGMCLYIIGNLAPLWLEALKSF